MAGHPAVAGSNNLMSTSSHAPIEESYGKVHMFVPLLFVSLELGSRVASRDFALTLRLEALVVVRLKTESSQVGTSVQDSRTLEP